MNMSHTVQRLSMFTAVCSLLLVAGCGGGGNGGGDNGGDTGTEMADTDNGGDQDSGGTTTTPKTGTVNILQIRKATDAGSLVTYSPEVTFERVTEPGDSSRCTAQTQGSCTFRDCARAEDQKPTTEPVSAGTVTIAGDQELTFEPGDDNTYDPEGGQGQIWESDRTIEISAAGDTVPAFSTELDALADITLQSPSLPAEGSSMTFDTSESLPVEWETDGLEGGDFRVALISSNDSRTTQIECEWDAGSGAEEVPAGMLGDMIQTDGGGTFIFAAGDLQTTDAGDYEVSVSALEVLDDGDATTSAAIGSDATFE